MSLVVDASLAVKWIVDEHDSGLARAFFLRYFEQMHAPDLLLVEAMGALVTRANDRRASAEDMKESIGKFRSRVGEAVRLHRTTPEQTRVAAELAMTLGHPIKDCVYLALADQLGCALATSDVKFRDRVADPARVKLLAELV